MSTNKQQYPDWLKSLRAIMEGHTGIKRAGADLIITPRQRSCPLAAK